MSTMKAIKIEATDVVVDLFLNNVEITLTDRGYKVPGSENISLKGIPLTVETGVSFPAGKFVPFAQTHIEGVWAVVDQEKYDFDPAALELQNAKKVKSQAISRSYEKAVDALVAGYPASEIDSWPQQNKEAQQYIDTESETGLILLPLMASNRGMTTADLASRVVTKAEAYCNAYGVILGTRQGREDALEDATTLAEVAAIETD